MEQEHAEVEQHPRRRTAVDDAVALGQMESARPDHQRRDLRIERVVFAGGGVLVGDGPADGVDQVGLSGDEVRPCRRSGVLEVGHEHRCARVQRIDDHLAVARSGDLDAPVLEVCWNRADLPVGATDVRGVGEKIRAVALVVALLHAVAAREKLVDAGAEAPGEILDERQRVRGEHALGSFDSGCRWKRHTRHIIQYRGGDCASRAWARI